MKPEARSWKLDQASSLQLPDSGFMTSISKFSLERSDIMERRQKGDYGEKEASRFLIRQGYSILEKNFRFHKQEIDIIALDRDTIVFIEVRSREEKGMVSPEESVNKRKQKNIIRTAQFYLQKKRWYDLPCRFDVVTILYDEDSAEIKNIGLIRNAFDMDQK